MQRLNGRLPVAESVVPPSFRQAMGSFPQEYSGLEFSWNSAEISGNGSGPDSVEGNSSHCRTSEVSPLDF